MLVSTLPKHYLDLKAKTIHPIRRRIPAALGAAQATGGASAGATVVAANTSAALDATKYRNGTGLPFEIDTVVPAVSFVDGTNAAILPAGVGTNVQLPHYFTSLTVKDVQSGETILDEVMIIGLVNADSLLWDLKKPYYLPPTYEWQIKVKNANGSNGVLCAITLRGSLLVLGPGQPMPANCFEQ